jgi:transcription elongation factor GreA
MSKKQPLTKEQYDRIVLEIDEIENTLIPENSVAIKIAKEQGDLSENAEYDDAKEKQAMLHQRLMTLKNKKENAVILKKSDNTDFVEIGHSVTVERTNDKEVLKLTLLGQWDGTKHSTSIDSPLGSGMLGKARNDSFTIEAPIGEISYKILNIE